MAVAQHEDEGGIAHLPVRPPDLGVVNALHDLSARIRAACPAEAVIGFRFDGKLHVDIDVRGVEMATLVETFLPTLCGEMFHDIRRSRSPRPFMHRVTAEVDA